MRAVFLGCMWLPFLWQVALAGCPAPDDITIAVNPVFGGSTYDFSYDVPAIQAMANDSVHKVREGWVLGLTRYEPVLEMIAPVSVTRLPEGQFCAQPVSITVNVGYKDMTILIPNELAGDSCGFDQVLRHEEEHVEIERQVLKKYVPLIREKFHATFALNGNAQAATSADAMALQRNMLRAALTDAAAQMNAEIDARQHEVDSPEEYHRLLGVCSGQLAELVDSTRREQILAQRF